MDLAAPFLSGDVKALNADVEDLASGLRPDNGRLGGENLNGGTADEVVGVTTIQYNLLLVL